MVIAPGRDLAPPKRCGNTAALSTVPVGGYPGLRDRYDGAALAR